MMEYRKAHVFMDSLLCCLHQSPSALLLLYIIAAPPLQPFLPLLLMLRPQPASCLLSLFYLPALPLVNRLPLRQTQFQQGKITTKSVLSLTRLCNLLRGCEWFLTSVYLILHAPPTICPSPRAPFHLRLRQCTFSQLAAPLYYPPSIALFTKVHICTPTYLLSLLQCSLKIPSHDLRSPSPVPQGPTLPAFDKTFNDAVASRGWMPEQVTTGRPRRSLYTPARNYPIKNFM